MLNADLEPGDIWIRTSGVTRLDWYTTEVDEAIKEAALDFMWLTECQDPTADTFTVMFACGLRIGDFVVGYGKLIDIHPTEDGEFADMLFEPSEDEDLIVERLCFDSKVTVVERAERAPRVERVVRDSGFAATTECYDSHNPRWMSASRMTRRAFVRKSHNRKKG